jgi:hypothetical protein
LNRILGIVALTTLFSLLVFPAFALAQAPSQLSQSEQMEETANVKNVVSLTTTDLLSSQDFAPPTPDLPTKRNRTVNPVKGAKTMLNVKPAGLEAEGLKTSQTNAGTRNATIEAGADLMRPVRLATQPPLEDTTRLNKAADWGTARVSTGNSQVDELMAQSARRNGVDQRLLYAMMKQESSFNPRALSYKGARGLMQLMPATAARFGVTDIYDPAQNIEGGARYVRFLLDTFNGDVELALAGYNAGENAVLRYGNRIPPYRETQDYVQKISAHYARLRNGYEIRRQPTPTTTVNKKAEMEILTVGPTMTQY